MQARLTACMGAHPERILVDNGRHGVPNALCRRAGHPNVDSQVRGLRRRISPRQQSATRILHEQQGTPLSQTAQHMPPQSPADTTIRSFPGGPLGKFLREGAPVNKLGCAPGRHLKMSLQEPSVLKCAATNKATEEPRNAGSGLQLASWAAYR